MSTLGYLSEPHGKQASSKQATEVRSSSAEAKPPKAPYRKCGCNSACARTSRIGSSPVIFGCRNFRLLCPNLRTSKSRIPKIMERTAAQPSGADVNSRRRFLPGVAKNGHYDNTSGPGTASSRNCNTVRNSNMRLLSIMIAWVPPLRILRRFQGAFVKSGNTVCAI